MHKTFLLALALCLPASAAVQPPQIGPVQLTLPLPLPYDDRVDANQRIDAALARAKLSGKRVLVDLGGNWCIDCRVFVGMLALPPVHQFVEQHFELVMVNVGRFNANLDIPARFGLFRLEAAPTMLVLSGQGELLNPGEMVALKDARVMSAQAVVDWLAKWAY